MALSLLTIWYIVAAVWRVCQIYVLRSRDLGEPKRRFDAKKSLEMRKRGYYNTNMLVLTNQRGSRGVPYVSGAERRVEKW